MILLTPLQAFNIFYKYIVENWELDYIWEVRDVYSEATIDPEIACHTGGPTNDPAVWEDWGIAVDDVLQNEGTLGLKVGENEPVLTLEQALKVMTYFLRERYCLKNHGFLLKDAMADINKSLAQENFEATDVWKEWLQCVPKALEFKETFDNAYFSQLEEMRQEYWRNKKLNLPSPPKAPN